MGFGSEGPAGHFGSLDQPAQAATGPWPGFGVGTTDVAATSGDGVSALAARGDHFHKGVHSLNGLFGDVTLAAGVQTLDGVVTGAAKLSTLASASFSAGALAYVVTVGDFFRLQQSALTVDSITVVAATGKATYQWIRLGTPNPAWQAQLTWSVDPSNSSGVASNENTGIDDAHPLLTHAECARRTWGTVVLNGSNRVVRHLSSDLAGASAVYNIAVVGRPVGSAGGITPGAFGFTIIGIPTVVYSGVMAAVVQAAAGTAADNHFTDGGAPAFSNANGRLWKRTNGTTCGFWPQKDLTAGSFRTSCPTRTFDRLVLANADTYQILQLPDLRDVTFANVQGGLFWSSFQQVNYLTAPPNSGGILGPSAMFHCDLTGLGAATAFRGAIQLGNCRNPFNVVRTSTQSAQPSFVVGGGLCDAAIQQPPATGRYFGAPNTAYLSFQGTNLNIDHNVEASEAQFMFYDNALDCIVVNQPIAKVNITSLGGLGNSAALVNVTSSGSTVVVGTFAAGATSGTQFKLGAASSATPNLVDYATRASCVVSA